MSRRRGRRRWTQSKECAICWSHAINTSCPSGSEKTLVWRLGFQCYEITAFLWEGCRCSDRMIQKARRITKLWLGKLWWALLFSAIMPTAAAQVPDANDPAMVVEADEALAIDARQYAQSYNVSYEEALRRLTIMLETANEVRQLEREDGADFAGAFFDNRGGNFGLIIRTKKALKPDRMLLRRGHGRFASVVSPAKLYLC